MKLKAPNGRDIVSTEELLPGQAIIGAVTGGNPEDGFAIDHEGTTDVDWDSQETRRACGQRVFVDDNGGLWLERELTLVDDEEGPAPKLKVTVEVTGGVAEVTDCPDGVEVEIIDHDNLEAEAAMTCGTCQKIADVLADGECPTCANSEYSAGDTVRVTSASSAGNFDGEVTRLVDVENYLIFVRDPAGTVRGVPISEVFLLSRKEEK